MSDLRAPPEPKTVEDTGLDEAFLCDLVLKHVYFGGTLPGIDLAQRVALDFSIVSTQLESLTRQHLVATTGGSGAFGGVWFRWSVTRQGREKVD